MVDYRKYFEKIINTNNKFIKNFYKKNFHKSNK